MNRGQFCRLLVIVLFPFKLPLYGVVVLVSFATQIVWMAGKWVRYGTPVFSDDPWGWPPPAFWMWPLRNEARP